MSSNPSSDTSSAPEAFANSSSAASDKYPTDGQSSAPPITSQSSRHGHKLEFNLEPKPSPYAWETWG
jgi:hypothetical protein